MTANDLTTPPLPLLVQSRPQVSFARDPSEGERGLGGGQITSKGDGLLRSNLPLGDSLLRGAGYFVTLLSLTRAITVSIASVFVNQLLVALQLSIN